MIRRPMLTLLIALALMAAAILMLRRLHVDTSLASLFEQDDPAAEALQRVMDRFAAVEELLVLVQSPPNRPPRSDVLIDFAQRLEQAISEDREASSLAAGVSYRADPQIRQFIEKVIVPNAIFYLDDGAFVAVQKRLTRAGIRAQIRRAEALMAAPGPAASAMAKAILQDPLRLHELLIERIAAGLPALGRAGSEAFLSRDGAALLIRIRGRRPVSDLDFSKRFVTSITSVNERINRDGLVVDYSGGYAIAARSEQAIRADMIGTIISSVALLQMLFIAAYRRPIRSFLLAFVPVGAGVLYGFGVYALFAPALTPMTAVIGGVLAGMSIDYAIEFITYYHAHRGAGGSAVVAARDTRRHVGGAIVAAWATSAACFAIIALSNVKALRDFAFVGGLGLTGAFVCALALLPALLVAVDRAGASAPMLRLPIGCIIALITRHRVKLIALTLAIFVLAAGVLALPGPTLPLESDLSVMHPRPNAPLEAMRKISQHMGTSPGGLMIHLRAQHDDQLLRLAHDVNTRLTRDKVLEAGVVGSLGLASVLPDPRVVEARVAATGDAVAVRVIADFRAAIADSIFDPAAYPRYEQFLHTMLTATKPPAVDDLRRYPKLAEMVLPASNQSGSAEAITLLFLGQAGEKREARDAIVNGVRGALIDLPGATLTGLSVLNHDTELTVRRDLPRLMTMALAAVALYLAVHFRNLGDSALAIVPTIISLVCVLAFMRLSGQKLNMINLVAFPLLIGIDIDYGIFIVSAARKRDPAQLAPAAAAVMLCAATTFLGFGSLMFTSVPAARSLGAAVAVGVASCAAATLLLVLPLCQLRRQKEPA